MFFRLTYSILSLIGIVTIVGCSELPVRRPSRFVPEPITTRKGWIEVYPVKDLRTDKPGLKPLSLSGRYVSLGKEIKPILNRKGYRVSFVQTSVPNSLTLQLSIERRSNAQYQIDAIKQDITTSCSGRLVRGSSVILWEDHETVRHPMKARTNFRSKEEAAVDCIRELLMTFP